MLDYNQYGFTLYHYLISWNIVKRSLSFSIGMASVTAIVVVLDKEAEMNISKTSRVYSELLDIFTYFFLIGLGFRLNTAFQTWNEGVNNIFGILGACKTLLSTLSVYVVNNDTNDDVELFKNVSDDIIRYVGMCFYTISGNNGKGTYNKPSFLVREDEAYMKSMYPSSTTKVIEEKLPSKKYALEIESRLKKRLLQGASFSFYSRKEAYQLMCLVDNIANIQTKLYKMVHIPPVCIYIQLFDFYMYVYMLIYIINNVRFEGYYACVFTGIWGFVIALAINISSSIDTPFGDELNDIELEILFKNFKADVTKEYEVLEISE